MTLQKTQLLWLTAFITVCFTIWVFATHPPGEAAYRNMLTITARISAVVFLLTYLASSLQKTLRTPFTLWLVRNRRHLGLSFALSHTVHLLFIILFFTASETTEQLDTVTLIFGGLGFVFVYLLALTSNDFSVRKLGLGNWKWLHRIGLHYLWFIFFITMSGAIMQRPVTLVIFVLFGMALLFRVYTQFLSNQKPDQSPPNGVDL